MDKRGTGGWCRGEDVWAVDGDVGKFL